MPLPAYAHLPLLVNEQRKKLSKRKDPVATEMYRDEGYLPAAFVNYLALLGWSPRGDEEIVPLVHAHRTVPPGRRVALTRVLRREEAAPHERRIRARACRADEFIRVSAPWVRPWSTDWRPSDREPAWREDQFSAALYAQVAPLVQERVATLGEIPAMVEFFFLDEPRYDEASFAKVIGNDPVGRALLESAIERYERLADWSAASLHEVVQQLGDEVGLALRKAQAPIRCAVTGDPRRTPAL